MGWQDTPVVGKPSGGGWQDAPVVGGDQKPAAAPTKSTDDKLWESPNLLTAGEKPKGITDLSLMENILGVGKAGIGLAEAGASALTNTGVGLAGAWRHPFDDKAQQEFVQRHSVQPWTQYGQDYYGALSKGMEQVGLGAMPEFSRLGAAGAMRPSAQPIGKPPVFKEGAPEVAAAQKAVEQGYKLPPSISNPKRGTIPRLLEGASGEIKTRQAAALENQRVSDALARKGLGLPEDTTITSEQIGKIHQNFRDVGNEIIARDEAAAKPTGMGSLGGESRGLSWKADKQFYDDIQKIEDPEVRKMLDRGDHPPRQLLSQIQSLREDARELSAKMDYKQAKQRYAAANTLEDLMDRKLQALGDPELRQKFRDAREMSAKAYDVTEAGDLKRAGAFNNISAKKMSEMSREKPLTGENRDIAEFGTRFPAVADVPKKGYQDVSGLRGMAAIYQAITGKLWEAAEGTGIPVAARKVLLSPEGQRKWAIPSTQPIPPSTFQQGTQALYNNPWAAGLIPPPPQEQR
jgi:hypothetical protein